MDFIEYPGADAGADITIEDCIMDTIEIFGNSLATPDLITYGWNTFENGNIVAVIDERTILADRSGGYRLSVTDTTNGCTSYDTMFVIQEVLEIEAAADNYTIIQNTTLNANVLSNDQFSGNTIVSIITNPTVGTVNIQNGGAITYIPPDDFDGEVVLVYELCSEICLEVCDTAIVIINVEDEIEVPNAISINGDGKNEFWVIPDIVDYEFRRVTVVNRWGDVVFKSNEYNNDWGGTYKGKYLPEGTYYYIIEIENGLFDREIRKGHLTIIR